MLLATTIACAHSAAEPVAPNAALGTCDDAIADAKAKKDFGWKENATPGLDADGDGTPECVLRGCHGSNCDVVVYRREAGGVRRIGAMTASFTSSPHCIDKPPAGTFCRLEVGVHMIHGETLPTYWVYAGTEYVEAGHGELIPGPLHYRHR